MAQVILQQLCLHSIHSPDYNTITIMNFYQLLEQLKLYDINYTIIGSHALYLLNKKLKLGIEVELSCKDLDIIVDLDETALKFISDFDFKQVNKASKNFTIYRILSDNNKNIDLISRINFRHMKINNTYIPHISHDTIKEYRYTDFLYNHIVNYINLELYYGVIKGTGLSKYKTIISNILDKYPDFRNKIIA